MSLQFITDTSTQTGYTSGTITTVYNSASNANINFNGNAGIYNASSTQPMIFFTSNLTALIIDSQQNISCMGDLNVSGNSYVNGASTYISSLNISGYTTLSNNTTVNGF